MDKQNLKLNISVLKKENLEKLIKIAQNTKPYIIIIEEIQREEAIKLGYDITDTPPYINKIYKIKELEKQLKENLNTIKMYEKKLEKIPTYNTKEKRNKKITEINQELAKLENEFPNLERKFYDVNKTEEGLSESWEKAYKNMQGNTSKQIDLTFEKIGGFLVICVSLFYKVLVQINSVFKFYHKMSNCCISILNRQCSFFCDIFNC
ncbi:hypothetical protein [Spiroplasma endosymbiont of Danaus chrysippus]|uniref:hypothetical protein n=1 Tax=Spiroplasma endosymbiont of Danaus chrysippus TaxID=2691041 RepID=UPI00157A6FDF|nr:hypothetical protein [Spiroplasma endosymbiont of Danaus chrysippus]